MSEQNGQDAQSQLYEACNVPTLRDMCRAAGITPSTKTRDDLIDALLSEGHDTPEAVQRLQQLVAGDDRNGADDTPPSDPPTPPAELAPAEPAEPKAATATRPAPSRRSSVPKESANALRLYRIWATRDCPCVAPTVCGIDFPQETEPITSEGPGGETRRRLQKGKLQKLSQKQIDDIKAKLAEPIARDDDGKLVTGKLIKSGMTDELVPLGPYGKFIFIEPAEVAGIPESRVDELIQVDTELQHTLRELLAATKIGNETHADELEARAHALEARRREIIDAREPAPV